jgi:hypothetical protein
LYIITGASSRNGAMAGITLADQITGDPDPSTILNVSLDRGFPSCSALPRPR